MPTFDEKSIVSAERNPKIHRPVFHGTRKAKTWVAKRVTGARRLVTNPKKALLPPTKDLEHLPKANVYTVASTIFGAFATGGTGAGFMFLADAVAGLAKANTQSPFYEPVRDVVRLAGEGILGLSIYPFAAAKITGDKDIGKAMWLGGTILTGVDLGVTVFKYVLKGVNAVRNKSMPTEAPAPTAAQAGMALVGLSGLAALVKGYGTVATPENNQTTPTPENLAGMDELALLEQEKKKFEELSGIMKGVGGSGTLVGGVNQRSGTLTR
ncbi:Uncharacterised protein [uncultured archaeon]|nr:Uncharacterised protein [uncultured archaeon]